MLATLFALVQAVEYAVASTAPSATEVWNNNPSKDAPSPAHRVDSTYLLISFTFKLAIASSKGTLSW